MKIKYQFKIFFGTAMEVESSMNRFIDNNEDKCPGVVSLAATDNSTTVILQYVVPASRLPRGE